MSLDFQSLSTDTLLYMLMHSGVFVAIMGTVFFLIGLIFGHATWGRYKNQTRVMAAEIDRQRQEIATLKRKLGDQNVKPGSAALATETLSTLPPASEPSTSDTLPPAQTSPAAPPLPPPSPALPADPITDTISIPPAADAVAMAADATAPKAKSSKVKSIVKAKAAEPKLVIEPLPAPVAPSSKDATSHASPLASIIAPQSPAVPRQDKPAPESLATAVESLDIIPALPELPVTGPAANVKPEHDPKLGLIYKSPPARCDDLTAMKGIAKVLEQRLHEFGIYTYQQIASWTEDQIKEFSSRLAFKDRIHREKWVEQARKLHTDTYGGSN